jgi:hypothetical protein
MKFIKMIPIIGLMMAFQFSCEKTNIETTQTILPNYYKIGVMSKDGSIEYSPIKRTNQTTTKIESNCNCLNFQNITSDSSIVYWIDCSGRPRQHIMTQYEYFTNCGNTPRVTSDKILITSSDSCCNVLPIKFKEFCITFIGNKTKLLWVIENEDVVSHYLVFKSHNLVDWNNIKSIPKSNGNGIYEFIDDKAN